MVSTLLIVLFQQILGIHLIFEKLDQVKLSTRIVKFSSVIPILSDDISQCDTSNIYHNILYQSEYFLEFEFNSLNISVTENSHF